MLCIGVVIHTVIFTLSLCSRQLMELSLLMSAHDVGCVQRVLGDVCWLVVLWAHFIKPEVWVGCCVMLCYGGVGEHVSFSEQ